MGTTGLYRPPLPNDARLAAAGQGMRRIRTSRPNVVWLQGPGPSDLFTWREGDGPIREQELTFFGHAVVHRDGRLLTGLSHEGIGAAHLGRTGLLDFDSVADPETLRAAERVLGAIPALARSEAVETFAHAVTRALSEEAPPAASGG